MYKPHVADITSKSTTACVHLFTLHDFSYSTVRGRMRYNRVCSYVQLSRNTCIMWPNIARRLPSYVASSRVLVGAIRCTSECRNYTGESVA